MARYRKKPVEIEAFRIGIDPIPDWAMDKASANEISIHRIGEIGQGLSPFDHSKIYFTIKTLEGVMTGNYGDYLIQGVSGELYPIKEDIFYETYEKVDEE